MNNGLTDHAEVTIDELFVEHYDPPAVPPKVSSAMKAARRREAKERMRLVPHPKSLLGIGFIGVAVAGAGFLAFRRWIA